MHAVIPRKLRPGDRIHVIAPSRSWASINNTPVEKESQALSIKRLESLGLRVTLGAHVWESGPFQCPSVEHRLADLHDAFSDPDIDAIITVIGGWNGNQILHDIDFDLVAANPKIFCGYSDISVFQGAFLKKANLVTYYGPHISTFGMKQGIEYTLEGLRRGLMTSEPYRIEPSTHWADDPWFMDQDNRNFIENEGYQVLQSGEAEGPTVGGNLCSYHLLQGTPYAPDIAGRILFFEDLRDTREFDRLLQSLLQGPGGADVLGLVIGRSPPGSHPKREWLDHMVQTKPELRGKPVIYGADFGHTTPHTTFPLGGTAWIRADADGAVIEIRRH